MSYLSTGVMDFVECSPSTYSAEAAPDLFCFRLSCDFILRFSLDKLSFDNATSAFLTPVIKTVSNFTLSDDFLTFGSAF